MLRAHRLMTAHVALVAVATIVRMTMPAVRAPAWAVIGLAGIAAVLIGAHVRRPAHRRPCWLPTAGLFTFIADAGRLATCPLSAAGLALPVWVNLMQPAAGPHLYSGPSPTASPATALAGLDVDDRRGDALRADNHHWTVRVLDHLDGLDAVAAFLWERASMSRRPPVPTALNSDTDIDRPNGTLTRPAARFPLKPKG
ncbi:hypothetical protein ACWC09_07215 [Streptomyces sp. NPDC001617]